MAILSFGQNACISKCTNIPFKNVVSRHLLLKKPADEIWARQIIHKVNGRDRNVKTFPIWNRNWINFQLNATHLRGFQVQRVETFSFGGYVFQANWSFMRRIQGKTVKILPAYVVGLHHWHLPLRLHVDCSVLCGSGHFFIILGWDLLANKANGSNQAYV